MTTSSETPKKSIWGPEQWLPHIVTAVALAILAGALAVIAGWWGLLQQALQGKQHTSLLLNTIGVLFLLLAVLSYSFYRAVKVLKVKKESRSLPLVSTPGIELPRILPDDEEALLIRLSEKGRFENVQNQRLLAILESLLDKGLVDRSPNVYDAYVWEVSNQGRKHLKTGGQL